MASPWTLLRIDLKNEDLEEETWHGHYETDSQKDVEWKVVRGFRKLSLEGDRYRRLNLNAIIMRSIVNRIHKSTQWRAFNTWVLSAEINAIKYGSKTQRGLEALERQQKERAAASLRGIVLRWSKKEVMRSFQTWSYHINVGIRLHLELSRERRLLH